MNKHIFWISSYPKSGNTLVRAILLGLFFSEDGKISLENLDHISQFETTRRLNFIKKINKNDFYKLNDLKILSKYWQKIQTNQELQIKKGFGFLKTHSCLVSIKNNFFTSEDITKGYIYIIRDPRDVCISWAKFSNYSIDESIDFMCNSLSILKWQNTSNTSLMPKNIFPLSLVSSWSEHVKSWTENKMDVAKLIIKYEDLITEKEKTIIQIKDFFSESLNINIGNFGIKLKNLLETTDFKNMQKMESVQGFKEAKSWTNFFREGKKEQWKEILNTEQLLKIEKNFNEYMKKYSYN
tara:strand:- start:2686 stop:3573 length:888 start_codon:yes stop_codon:yes gene_type:complete